MQLQILGTLLLSGVFLLSGGKGAPAPTLISPANGAVMDNGCYPKRSAIVWDFDWTDVPGAGSYNLIVWRGSDKPLISVEVKALFAAPSSYHWTGPPEVARSTSPGRNPRGFYFVNANLRGFSSFYIPNTELKGWRWKVQAIVGSDYLGGKWSAVHRFRVEPLNTDCR